MDMLGYNPKGCFLDSTGLHEEDFTNLHSPLEAARREMLEVDAHIWSHPPDIPIDKQPLDAGFLELPERLLTSYRDQRSDSELGTILSTASRLRESVDRVVVLGIGGSYMGARALMEACCEPYFNELSRADRGGRPRMYFEGNNVDNDATTGLLKLVGTGKLASNIDDRWALVVISKSGGTLETAVAFRQFLDALKSSCGNASAIAELVVPITGRDGSLFDLATKLGCNSMFQVPTGVGGRFSMFSPVGLLPAAILGIDIVKLLEGAAAMNDHFRNAPIDENIVLQYVGVSHLTEIKGATIRVLNVWSKALEATGLWYDQLLAESLGKQLRGATPLTTVNTRDLHSRAQQHQEGRFDKLHTNLIVDQWRTDSLRVGHQDDDVDRLNDLADKTLPEIMTAAIEGTNQAYKSAGRPTADLHLPQIDESSLGQLFQMLMLATVAEGRLLGINPYGQPGVEAYKTNMNRILDRK